MKKLFVGLLTIGMLSVFVGCGSDDVVEEEIYTEDIAPDETVTEDVEEDVVEEPSEETTEDGAAADGTLAALKEAVVAELGENYWANAEVPAEYLEGNMGVTADMYDEVLAEMPMISNNVDTMIIVKAKADQVEAVEAALTDYQARMQADTMQYPSNLGKIQASKVAVFGEYVCFVQLGADTMEISESGDEAVIAHCEAENEKALNAIEAALNQ